MRKYRNIQKKNLGGGGGGGGGRGVVCKLPMLSKK